MSEQMPAKEMTPEYSRWLAKAKQAAEYWFVDAMAGTIIAEEGIAAGSKEKFEKAEFLDFLIDSMEKDMKERGLKPVAGPGPAPKKNAKKEWRYRQ